MVRILIAGPEDEPPTPAAREIIDVEAKEREEKHDTEHGNRRHRDDHEDKASRPGPRPPPAIDTHDLAALLQAQTRAFQSLSSGAPADDTHRKLFSDSWNTGPYKQNAPWTDIRPFSAMASMDPTIDRLGKLYDLQNAEADELQHARGLVYLLVKDNVLAPAAEKHRARLRQLQEDLGNAVYSGTTIPAFVGDLPIPQASRPVSRTSKLPSEEAKLIFKTAALASRYSLYTTVLLHNTGESSLEKAMRMLENDFSEQLSRAVTKYQSASDAFFEQGSTLSRVMAIFNFARTFTHVPIYGKCAPPDWDSPNVPVSAFEDVCIKHLRQQMPEAVATSLHTMASMRKNCHLKQELDALRHLAKVSDQSATGGVTPSNKRKTPTREPEPALWTSGSAKQDKADERPPHKKPRPNPNPQRRKRMCYSLLRNEACTVRNCRYSHDKSRLQETCRDLAKKGTCSRYPQCVFQHPQHLWKKAPTTAANPTLVATASSDSLDNTALVAQTVAVLQALKALPRGPTPPPGQPLHTASAPPPGKG